MATVPTGVAGKDGRREKGCRKDGTPVKVRHIVTDVDRHRLIGDCSQCGPGVSIYIQQSTQKVSCLVAKRKSQRGSAIKLNYGLSQEDHALLLSVQDGLCAICKTPETPERPLHVDHCHATGKVRGLLCFNCNAGLGKFGDDIARMSQAIYYLAMYAEEPATIR